MAVVSLKIGPKAYKFSCADGQEAHMQQLAEGLNARAEKLIQTLGYMQEGQMLAMMCLLISEEKSKLEKETNAEILEKSESQMAEALKNLALKIETLAENIAS
ncbi:MAG: cell division protein ZapA [Pseudomonadota bacterium]|nr:cell division protein ZapA [Pseudomonadota bacterium]